MTPALRDDLLAPLSGWATESFGLRFPPDRWGELARGVAAAALELGIADLDSWAELLATGGAPEAHVAVVANHLTISETYFFRHSDSFDLLEHDILPARLAARVEQRSPIRIWSAGCATGEEPYSVAMLLRQRFPASASSRSLLYGTDINSQVLQRARRGVYSEWSFRETQPWVKSTYFKRLANGRYEIHPEIREMVRFSPLNFVSPIYPPEFSARGDFDVILCRNVLMYFSAEWQDRILRRLTLALTHGGWLLAGPCDVAMGFAHELGLQSVGPGYFQRTDEPAPYIDRPGFLNTPRRLRRTAVAAVQDQAAPETSEPIPASAQAGPAPVPQPSAELLAADFVAPTGEQALARAQEHADRGELDEALLACEQAIAADKANPGYHYLRGCILQEQNRPGDAEAAFRRVLFLEPNSALALFALGSLADRSGRRDQSRHYFRQVLRALEGRSRNESLPGAEGLTVARLQAVVADNLAAVSSS